MNHTPAPQGFSDATGSGNKLLPFPATVYEGYVHLGRSGWTPVFEAFSEDLGICMSNVVDDIGRDYPMQWRIRRTDIDPDTGEIDRSYFVDEREARAACTNHRYLMDEAVPDWVSGIIEGPDPENAAYDDWVSDRQEAAE